MFSACSVKKTWRSEYSSAIHCNHTRLLLVLSNVLWKSLPIAFLVYHWSIFLSSHPALASRLLLEGQSGGWGVMGKTARNGEWEEDLCEEPGKDGSWQHLQVCAELCAYLVISSAQSTPLPSDTLWSQLPWCPRRSEVRSQAVCRDQGRVPLLLHSPTLLPSAVSVAELQVGNHCDPRVTWALQSCPTHHQYLSHVTSPLSCG